MYAVIATGGKQYRVTKGETLRVEKLEGEEGSAVELEGVLMVADGDNIAVGTPMLDSSAVTVTIKSHGRGKKVDIVKFRRRKHSRRQAGHRQSYTEIQIDDINNGKGAAKAEAPKADADKLTIIEGIGPKIAELLNIDGIVTFSDLAKAKVDTLSAILEKAGSRYTMHKPDTWPQQAALARDGKMDELKKLQDELDGGKPPVDED